MVLRPTGSAHRWTSYANPAPRDARCDAEPDRSTGAAETA